LAYITISLDGQNDTTLASSYLKFRKRAFSVHKEVRERCCLHSSDHDIVCDWNFISQACL